MSDSEDESPSPSLGRTFLAQLGEIGKSNHQLLVEDLAVSSWFATAIGICLTCACVLGIVVGDLYMGSLRVWSRMFGIPIIEITNQ